MKNLEQLKETYKKLGEEIKEIENSKIDFSKWIGRYNTTTLSIKGDKNLVSYRDGDILYTNKNVSCSDDKINYEHTILSKLEIGDIFILKDNLDNIKLSNFNIFIGKDKCGDYEFQYLSNLDGTEKINYDFIMYGHNEVIKFLRKNIN